MEFDYANEALTPLGSVDRPRFGSYFSVPDGFVDDAKLAEVVEEGEEDDEEGPDIFHWSDEMEAQCVGEGGGGEEEEAEDGIEPVSEDLLRDGGEEVEEEQRQSRPDSTNSPDKTTSHERSPVRISELR